MPSPREIEQLLKKLLYFRESQFSVKVTQQLDETLKALEAQMDTTPREQISWAAHRFIERIKEMRQVYARISPDHVEEITIETLVQVLTKPLQGPRNYVLRYIYEHPDNNRDGLLDFYKGDSIKLSIMLSNLKSVGLIKKDSPRGGPYKLTPAGESRAEQIGHLPSEVVARRKMRAEGATKAVMSYLQEHEGESFTYKRLGDALPDFSIFAIRNASLSLRSGKIKTQVGKYEGEKGTIRYLRVEEKHPYSGPIKEGVRVTVKTDNEQEFIYAVVNPTDANPQRGRVSTASPMGSALLGRQIGDEIYVKAPRGTTHYKIIHVEV